MNVDRPPSDTEEEDRDALSPSDNATKPQDDKNKTKLHDDAIKPQADETKPHDRKTNPLSSDDQYPLPKPDGDQWEILFRPKLEADTLRCNAWKDEVQNLLIFAGLFSAVVTAFIVESYKFLQPDPSDAIIGLLFHIANGLNNTAAFPPSVSPESITNPFLRTPSSIRINVFWIISLILSLATVLIGTIALQWLREHQSYVGYDSQEKLAILHMRSKAMEAWYLPQVFVMLPLLLQAALVLFLAGLIDFSFRLGSKLTIPVSIVIGLTLLFFAATTIFPSIQGLSFFCGLYPRGSVPNPCPFKSPQSHALRTLVGIILRSTLFRIFPLPEYRFVHGWPWKWIFEDPSVYNLWSKRTWLTFDREWLCLRDACHQRILDRDPDIYNHRATWEESFPLSDVTKCLVETVDQTPITQHTELFLVALVHCFYELSESIWKVPSISLHSQRMDRRNNYFEQLHWKPSCSLSTFFLHDGVYRFDRFSASNSHCSPLKIYLTPEKTRLFCDDQTAICLSVLRQSHNLPVLAEHQLALWSRILRSSNRINPFTSTVMLDSQHDLSIPVPTIMGLSAVVSNLPKGPVDQRFSAAANVLSALLDSTAPRQSMRSLCAHQHMVNVFYFVAHLTDNYLRLCQKDTPTRDALRDVDEQFVKIFRFMADHLNKKWNTSSGSRSKLDVFFYLSSIFVWGLVCEGAAHDPLMNEESCFGQALRSLIDALRNAWSFGQKDELIEKRFKLVTGSDDGRFPDGWWHQLFALNAIRQVPSSMEESHFHCDISSQVDVPSENTTAVGTSPLPCVTSLGTIDHSLIVCYLDGELDNQSSSTQPDSQNSRGKSASDSVDHAGDNTLHSPSYSLATRIHPATKMEEQTSADDPHPHSQPLSNRTCGTHSPPNESISADTVPQSLLPPNSPNPACIGERQAMVTAQNHKDGHELQSILGDVYSVIDAGSSAFAVCVGAVEDGIPQNQSRQGHMSVDMEYPI